MNFDYCAPLMLLVVDEALLEEQLFSEAMPGETSGNSFLKISSKRPERTIRRRLDFQFFK